MHAMFMWPALTIVAGAAACVAAVEDAGNRTIFYWALLPSLLLGAAFALSHFAGI